MKQPQINKPRINEVKQLYKKSVLFYLLMLFPVMLHISVSLNLTQCSLMSLNFHWNV